MGEPLAAAAPEELGSPLPDGTRLHEFTLERVLGVGGFGIVYLARDTQLQRTVALKEYMPSSLASRQTGFGVAVRSERHRETFELGLRSFVNEARLLASFDHPSLVKVYRFWEQNDTAYMVMPYYEGPTLRAWLQQQPQPPDEAWFKRLLQPLLDALDLIHGDRCYHRDIAPDNIILVGPQQRPVLLDFGAARRVIGDATQALTTILKPGYAPIEQYAEVPSMKQGAWTDVYALCAVLYAALTSRPPVTAVARMMTDELVPVAQVAAGRYSGAFLSAIDAGLALRPEHRPQSIAALRQRLFAAVDDELTLIRPAVDDERTVLMATPREEPRPPAVPQPPAVAPPAPPRKTGLAMVGGVGALVVLAGAVWFFTRGPAPAPVPVPVPVPQPTAQRAEFGTVAVLDDIVRNADPQVAVSAVADKPRLVIGRDRMSFRVKASEAGHLYVFLSGTDQSHLSLLFPNALDSDNRIAAGVDVVLPRKGWQITAGGPAGTNHVVAMVSRQPRDFVAAGLRMGETIPEFDLQAMRQAWGGNKVAPGAGEARCAGPGDCDGRYGAALIRIDEVAGQ